MGILDRLRSGPKAAQPPQDSASLARSDACIARGHGLEDAGDLAGAERAFREAIAAAPGHPRAHINLGNALNKQGRLEEAAQAHRAALALDASYAPAHCNLGAVLVALGDCAGAREHLERALASRPDMADAAVLLAEACQAAGDLDEARRALERALAIDPHLAGAAVNLGALHFDAGRIEEARGAFEAALREAPGSTGALTGLGRIELLAGDARTACATLRKALALDEGDAGLWSSYLFALNFRDDLDGAAIAAEHRRFGELFAALPRPERRARPRRLRVGYVSGDFAKHPVGLFLRPVLRHHDRGAVEVYCYASAPREDELTRELRESADHWRAIHGHGDESAARRIRDDGIDILVDLSGHTASNRLGVFARRPAPVQATWLGYLNTTGLAAMDFRICDAHTDPAGATEALSSERLARLPNAQWCYVPYHEVALAADPARPAGEVLFGSFNQSSKLGDACLDLWCEILRALPRSRLAIHSVPTVLEGGLRERFVRRGIDGARISMRGRLSILDYFAAISAVDIALDAFPYNGATTTLDALWMGVPMVALAGERALSRGSASIARAAGLDELVVDSRAAYIRRNVELANDPRERAALRSRLRARLEASAVMDAPRFVRDLEALYRVMWETD